MIRKTIIASLLAMGMSPALAQVVVPRDAQGRITASGLEVVLNALSSASKDAANITTGILAVDRLPAIPAAKITGLSAASVAGLGSYVLADSTGATDASAPNWMFWPGAGGAVYVEHDVTTGGSVQFNYVLLNAQSRIRPQDFGAAIIYLGR